MELQSIYLSEASVKEHKKVATPLRVGSHTNATPRSASQPIVVPEPPSELIFHPQIMYS